MSNSEFTDFFESEFKRFYVDLETDLLSLIKENPEVKTIKIREKFYFKLSDLKMRLSYTTLDNISFTADIYTVDLFKLFLQELQSGFKLDFKMFFDKTIQPLKIKYIKSKELALPENIKRNEKETLELLAQFYAVSRFIDQLQTFNNQDSIETLIEKIKFENLGNEPSEIQQSSNTLENVEEKSDSVTTAQQVLAIKILFEYAKIQKTTYDNSQLARFMQFLTGKELNNKVIASTNLYKQISDTENKTSKSRKKDLRVVRNYFSAMNLLDIVALIDEKIEKIE